MHFSTIFLTIFDCEDFEFLHPHQMGPCSRVNWGNSFFFSELLAKTLTTSLAKDTLRFLSPRLVKWNGSVKEWGSHRTKAMSRLYG